MRTCIKCGETKPLELMTKGKAHKDGRRNTCKACDAKRMREYFKSKPEQYEKNKTIPRDFRPNWKRHGLPKEQYETMYALYDGKCHSCKVNQATCVDHDHACCPAGRSCGKCVRGLLCNGCNASLGHMQDDLDRIKNLMLYLSTRSGEVRSFSPAS